MASINSSSKTIMFKCHQHAALISEKLQNFYKQNEFFDTVLVAGSGSNSVNIQAHRVVLCALSEYFLQIFRCDSSALKGNALDLKKIEASTLKLIIDFMYSGSMELSFETVGGILRTALILKIKSLVDGCCEFLEENINASNCLSSFRLAYELNLFGLKTKAKEYAHTHFEEITKGEELLMLSENELKDLLFTCSPHETFEKDVFLAIVAWIKYDKSNREHLVLELLSMVRFQALTPKFIVENRKYVCRTVESYELICSWLQWHLSTETRSNDQEKISDNLAVVKAGIDRKINIEIFNPKVNSWSTKIETHHSTENEPSSIIVIDGKLIVAGSTQNNSYSDSFEYFDLQTSEWKTLPPMKKDRLIWHMAELKGNLCVLGNNLNGKKTKFFTKFTMEMYSFSTCEWHDLQPPSQPSKWTRMATHNDMLYLIDFHCGFLQSYNNSSNKWTSKKIEKDSLCVFGFAAVDGFLYIIGGESREGFFKASKRYNLSNDSWCEMASLPNFPSVFKTTVCKNKIIFCSSANVDEYSIDTDTWNTLSPFKLDYTNRSFYICNISANK